MEKAFFSLFRRTFQLPSSEIQTFESQSQSRSTVIAGWPRDPRRSWMPGGGEKKHYTTLYVHTRSFMFWIIYYYLN